MAASSARLHGKKGVVVGYINGVPLCMYRKTKTATRFCYKSPVFLFTIFTDFTLPRVVFLLGGGRIAHCRTSLSQPVVVAWQHRRGDLR